MKPVFWPPVNEVEMLTSSRRLLEESRAVLRVPYWPRDFFPAPQPATPLVAFNHIDEELEREIKKLSATVRGLR